MDYYYSDLEILPRRGRTTTLSGGAFDSSTILEIPPHMIVNRIARTFRLNARSAFRGELHQVFRPVTVSNPMVVEKRPGPGDQVRVREGVFRDVEGTVLERINELRLVVAVRLVQQGVTLEIDERSLDVIG